MLKFYGHDSLLDFQLIIIAITSNDISKTPIPDSSGVYVIPLFSSIENKFSFYTGSTKHSLWFTIAEYCRN